MEQAFGKFLKQQVIQAGWIIENKSRVIWMKSPHFVLLQGRLPDLFFQ